MNIKLSFTALSLLVLSSCGTSGNMGRVISDTKSSMENAGHRLGDAIGFEDRLNPEEDYIRVGGYDYMPIYNVNLYKGSDSKSLCDECVRRFSSKYPNAVVQTVAIPQQDWLSEAIKKDKVVTGYTQTVYCYVIARDGSDGYINAKFMYQRYKDVGESYQKLNDKWPKWVKTDILTAKVYDKLLSK